MFRDLFNFRGINWWTLLGGIGLNFLVMSLSSLAGAYLASNEATAEFYNQVGPALMVLIVFVVCVATGWIIAKIADDVPVKHGFISSLGAVVPYLYLGVISLNPIPFMLAAVAAAGNLNGGMLAIRRRTYHSPRRD